MPSIRVVHIGLGPIGAAVAQQISERPGFVITGAIDLDPSKIGHDVGDVIGASSRLRVRIQDDADAVLKAARPDVVVHCTSSSLRAVMPQLARILKFKVPIVSTTEELAYPWRSEKRLAREIDAMARKANVAVLATGVNPGFAMDAFPIMVTAACARVEKVAVNRIQDARIRRLPFQQKIGAGLSAEEFEERVAAGTVRHVGFRESIAMIADAVGFRLSRITDSIRPQMAAKNVSSDFLKVRAGQVAGIIQDGVGYVGDEAVITLHLEAYLGAPQSYDSVEITGVPHLTAKFEGGIHGDIATASMTVNAIPKVLSAAPGLRTMRDITLPSFFSGKIDKS
jgi:4-hydroxy-tetrahydrodipicolinate reductase